MLGERRRPKNISSLHLLRTFQLLHIRVAPQPFPIFNDGLYSGDLKRGDFFPRL